MQDFLAKVKELQLKTISQEEAMSAINKLKAEVDQHNNPYIKDLLARKQKSQ